MATRIIPHFIAMNAECVALQSCVALESSFIPMWKRESVLSRELYICGSLVGPVNPHGSFPLPNLERPHEGSC